MNKIFNEYNRVGDDFFYHHTKTEASDTPYVIGPEVHTAYEALYLINGELSYVIEGQTYEVGRGALILVSPNAIHTLKISAGCDYERAVILFDVKIMQRLFSELDVEMTRVFTEGRLPVRIVSAEAVKKYGFDRAILSIIGEDKNSEYKKLRMISGLIEFLIALDKLVKGGVAFLMAPSSSDHFIRKVVEFIDAHISEEITLDRLARELFVSKSTLCHRFSSYMNVTINRYIAIKKIHLANELIRSGKSVEAAAIAVGYENYTSFYYNFKKIMKKSPAECR